MQLIGSNTPFISNIESPDLFDYTEGYQRTMEAANESMAVARRGVAIQAEQIGQDYQAKINRIQQESEANKSGGSNVFQGVAQLGGTLLTAFATMDEIERRKAAALLEAEAAARKEGREEREVQLKERAEDLNLLKGFVDTKVEEIRTYVTEQAANGNAQGGITEAKRLYKEFLDSDEVKALTPAQRLYVSSWAQKGVADLWSAEKDDVKKEREQFLSLKADNAHKTWYLGNTNLLTEIAENTQMTDEQLSKSLETLKKNFSDLTKNDPELAAALGDKATYYTLFNSVLQDVGEALTNRAKKIGTMSDEANRWAEAAKQLSTLEGLRLSGTLSDSDFAVAAGQMLKDNGLDPDASKFPTSTFQQTEQRIQRAEQENRLAEVLARDENVRSLMETTGNTERVKSFQVAVGVYQSIKEGTIDSEIARVDYLLKSSPERAKAQHASEKKAALSQWQDDLKYKENLVRQIQDTRKQLAEYGFKDTLGAVETINREFGVAPTLVTIDAPKDASGKPIRVPTVPPEGAIALGEKIQSFMREHDNLKVKWAQRGINIDDPSDTSYLNKLQAVAQPAIDQLEVDAAARGIDGKQPAESYTPAKNDQINGKVDNALRYELNNTPYWTTSVTEVRSVINSFVPPAAQNAVGSLTATFLTAQADTLVSLVARGNLDGATNLISTLGENYRNNPAYKMLTPDSQAKVDKWVSSVMTKKFTELLEWSKGKTKWYREKFGASPIPSGGTPVNFSNGGANRSLPPPPKNEKVATPAVATRGLAVAPNIGYLPFKGVGEAFDKAQGDRIADYYLNNYDSIRNNTKKYYNGANDCAATASTALIMAGIDIEQTKATGDIQRQLKEKGWTPITDMTQLRRGDVVFTTKANTASAGNPTHVYIFNGYTDNTKQFAYVIDNQGKNYVRNLFEGGKTPGEIAYRNSGDNPKITVKPGAHGINLTSSDPRVATIQGGTVLHAAPYGDLGNTVIIRTPDGFTELYSNLKVIGVKKGQTLQSGSLVGVYGQKGNNLYMEVWGSNSNLGSGQKNYMNPIDYLKQVTLKWDRGRDVGSVNSRDTTTSTPGVFRLSDNLVYFNGYVLDKRNLKLRRPSQEEMDMVKQTQTTNPTQPTSLPPPAKRDTERFSRGIGKGLSINKVDYGTNETSANYGYKKLANDPKLRASLVKAANTAGVPAVWLADLIQRESGWREHRVNDDGFTGLIQLGDASATDLGIKKSDLLAHDIYWQLENVVGQYIKMREKQAGKKIQTMEDLIAGVWQGNRGLKMDTLERWNRLNDRNTNWTGYLAGIGKEVGRTYSWSRGKKLHNSPRSGCNTCTEMSRLGQFSPHYGD